MSAPRIRYHLNVRAALVLTALGLAAALGLYFLAEFQQDRLLRAAMAQVRGFRTAGEEEKDPQLRARDYDLALRHVSQYMASRPDDLDALEIQADLLHKVGGDEAFAAIPVYEHILRVIDKNAPKDPKDPRFESYGRRAQAARRSLAKLDISQSHFILRQKYAQLLPEEVSKSLRFHVAEVLLDQLLDSTARPRVDDAEAHRLRAMALEGQVIEGSTTREERDEDGNLIPLKDEKGEPIKVGDNVQYKTIELRDYAIKEYEAALRRDPGDLNAALGLANAYKTYRNDPKAARKVLDGMLKSGPVPVEARLARYQAFKDLGEREAAAAELKEAALQAPENVKVIVTAASDALDAQDTKAAREALGRLPETVSDTAVKIRVLYLKGLTEYLEQNLEGTLSAWNEGLQLSGGTDAELTWRLASVELERGRDAEAGKLVDQFRRLAGDDSPALWWLETLQDERAGRYQRAADRLEKMLGKKSAITDNMRGQINMALGRCLEKIPDAPASRAEAAFRRALEITPESLAPRLALSELLRNTDPASSVAVLEPAQEAHPDNPTVLLSLAAARLEQQLMREAERRNWSSFDAIYQRAAKANPNSPFVATLHARRLASIGKLDEAIQIMKEVVAKNPRIGDFPNLLADFLFQQGHADQALQALERASAPDAAGDLGLLRISRAKILSALGRGREARALLCRDLVKIQSANRDELWKSLVLLCQSHGDREAAREAYAEWARQLPDYAPPKFILLELEIAANDGDAIERRLEELDPSKKKGADLPQDNLIYPLAQARSWLWKRSKLPDKDKDGTKGKALLLEAANRVEYVLKYFPSHPGALLIQGLVHEAEGEPERAIRSYSEAWSGGSAEAMLRLVNLMTIPDPERSDADRADLQEKLDKLWKADPTKEIDRIVAMACFRNKDPKEAQRVVEESLRAHREAKPWHAEMFELLGQSRKAEDVLRKMAEQQPENLERWLALVRHQATHDRSSAMAETLAEVRRRFRNDRPELIEAECLTAAADRPGADKAFEAALKRYPNDRIVLLTAERYYEGTAHLDRAEACLRSILDRDPNDRPVARQLAVVLSSRPETWAQALALLGPEGPPNDSSEDRLMRGIVLARSPDPGQQKQGTVILDALVADLPADNNLAVVARGLLVRLLIASGDAARASRVAATSAMTSSDPAAIALYVETLIQAGRFDTAEAQVDRLRKLGVTGQSEANLRARLIQGRSLQERATTAKSAETLEQAYLAHADTNDGEAYGREIFPMLIAMGPDARGVAGRLARRLAQKSPALSWMPALVLANQGNRDEALALCRTAAQAGSNPADLREAGRVALEVSVSARLEATALDQAVGVLDMALRSSPDFDDLLVMKAMVSHLQARFHEEERLYRAVLSHQPNHPVVLNNLAWVLSEGLDRPREGLVKIDLLIKLAGRREEYLDTRGVILSRLGRLDEAIKDLEEVVQAEPTGLHFYHLALTYRKAGRDAECRKALQEVRKAGLSTNMLDPAERSDFEAIMKL